MSIGAQVATGRLRWFMVARYLLFIGFLSGLLILCSMNKSFEIKRPSILAIAAMIGFYNFNKTGALQLLQRVVLVYILEVIFSIVSDQCIQIKTALASISIPWAAIFILLLFLTFVLGRQVAGAASGIEKNEILGSWAAAAGIIAAFMLALAVLFKAVYGYGFEHNGGVIGRICLYFLVFLFSWEQLHNIWLQRIAAICFAGFFGLMTFGEV